MQNYANHRQFVPGFHFVTMPLLLATFIGSLVNLYHSLGDHERIYSASLISALTLGVMLVALFARLFALKAQDRAIRAEENLRHYVLTGKLLDPALSVHQIIALRFASDAELADMARRASAERLQPASIKQAVKNWREDLHRV